MRQKGDSKPLVSILGIPLIERVIRSTMEAGVDDFYVVLGWQSGLVRDFLERLAKRLEIRRCRSLLPAYTEINRLLGDGRGQRPL